jgi:hypothetical protein
MLAGRLGRRGYASLPGALFKLQEIPLADFGVVSWLEHEYLQNSKGGLGWVNKSGIVKAPQCSSVIFFGSRPLNRSHNPKHPGHSASGIDCIVVRRTTWAAVQPPRGRSDAALLGHETARPAHSPHGAI